MTHLASAFSGSYAPGDVTFLLKPVVMPTVDVDTKEAEIQSGRRHYSEMLSPEEPPPPAYMETFRRAFDANRARVGRDVASLAKALADRPGREVVLVSLARAGTPIGVLLRRTLEILGRSAVHYSVSIIRDRGLDLTAMRAILARHTASDVVFIDGWTGKGAIRGELSRSTARDCPELAAAPLCVLSDLAGVADLAAGDEDYVIPSAILNGIISGLVSRSVLSDAVVGPGDFHGCVVLDHLAPHDLSRWYVDAQMDDVRAHLDAAAPAQWDPARREEAARVSAAFVEDMLARTGVGDRNRVKPGIGEATRALLRRVPHRLFVRDAGTADLAHLLTLAAAKGITPDIDPDLPYGACAIIKTLGPG
ncbi:cysteine protease StiP domain-containing protein [uncultured Rhodospira sp.]|mgnify:CR=1 FL=1|uniref:cysteine protease StiP domain-containing protein n=1 Tax=uncultured Rhodospira sp. TaxID=1936189 RepID=UPI00261802DE|nr:cysteine protease StiP domain-containing protein [uncultured Rhodospira sp.]